LGEGDMGRKVVLLVLVSVLLFSVFAMFDVGLVGAGGTIYIRADGSIDPTTAPISSADNITYSFTDNITDSIVVERDSIIVNGAGYTLQGNDTGRGIDLTDRSNVTVKNTRVTHFQMGIYLYNSSHNTISVNSIVNNTYGVYLVGYNNTVSGNNVTYNYDGIDFYGPYNTAQHNNVTYNKWNGIKSTSDHITICFNHITDNGYGIQFGNAHSMTVKHNSITMNDVGIVITGSSQICVISNNITNNGDGIYLTKSSDNTFFHNNIIGNTRQVYIDIPGYVNSWDDGYPSSGNYWSDYIGSDLQRGPYQNETGSDGIGDTPYTIDADNIDRYPLMNPWSPLPVHNINTGFGYNTIQEAIDASETLDGHTIFAEERTYYENVVVDKSLSLIGADKFNTIIDGNSTGNVVTITASNVTISGFTTRKSGYAKTGIYVTSGDNNISNNIITNNNECGVLLYSSSNNTVSGNKITDNGYGIRFSSSSYNVVSGNKITDNNYNGVDISSSSINNTISGNTITSNGYNGVAIASSANNTVLENSIANNNQYGVRLSASCNIVSENDITENNYSAIYFSSGSANNTISENNITKNGDGIYLSSASNNVLYRNNITDNNNGVSFTYSSYNNVSGNIIRNHTRGIYLYWSSNNTFFHNNFINNTQQVSTSPSNYGNVWDDDYPSGGNYWNDYTGNDLYSGTYQNETDSDGIGDTPYTIDADNTDMYPLMGPFGPLTMKGQNVTVMPSEEVRITYEEVLEPGLTASESREAPEEALEELPYPYELAEEAEKCLEIKTTAKIPEGKKIVIRKIYKKKALKPEALKKEEDLRLMEWDETTEKWIDVTKRVDTIHKIIYAETTKRSIFAVVAPLTHDIAVTNITTSKIVVGQGFTLSINVTVTNQGDYTETLNVTAYANATVIATLSNITLPSGNSTTLTILWNTTTTPKGNYTIKAHITPLPTETDTTDNTHIDGTVLVTIPGDVNGDRTVNMKDLYSCLTLRFGCDLGEECYVPNYDVNCDGKINMADIYTAVLHFGEEW
jgi:parallel beta-helix repeat protein